MVELPLTGLKCLMGLMIRAKAAAYRYHLNYLIAAATSAFWSRFVSCSAVLMAPKSAVVTAHVIG